MKNKIYFTILMLILTCVGIFAPNANAAEPILMKEPDSFSGTTHYILGNTDVSQTKADIATISIENVLPSTLPSGAWDVSKAKDNSVYAWLTVNASDSTKYDLHIAADGNVIASSGDCLFANYTNCTSITGLDKLDISNVTTMAHMFFDCQNLIDLDVTSFDTSNVSSMKSVFHTCKKLVNIDVSTFNTSKVTDMNQMFGYCSSLTSLDVSNFNTSNVADMSSMFSGCSSLTSLDLSNFNTSNVTNMYKMFMNCIKLTSLDVSNFDTSNVTDMSSMFRSCSELTSLDVSNFDTSNVTNMSSMFSSCRSLTSLDLSNFDTNNVTNMSWMFSVCSSLTSMSTGLDLSNTAITSNDSTSNGYAQMFYGCSSLTSATINSKYIGYRMFYGCNKLTDITITSDVQGVYNDGTGTPSEAFKYTGSGTLATVLNSSSTVITEENYDWAADKRTFEKPDTLAPTGTITLGGTYHEANGYKYVKTNVVTINLTVVDDKTEAQNIKIALINENEYDRTKQNSTITWQDFSTTKQWTSSSGKGLKRVYIIFKDEAGNQSVYFAN